jgi:large subunit ribosomal protein L9
MVQQAQGLSDRLAEVSLTFPVKVGEEGKLFGSVTNLHIEKALKEKGFEVERRKIALTEPIKTVGDYEVPIRLAADVTANVKVAVVSEDADPEPESARESTEEDPSANSVPQAEN